jgi:hypothetical protein
VLGEAVSALETGADARAPGVQRALDELRKLRKRKEDSLEAPVDLTTSGATL